MKANCAVIFSLLCGLQIVQGGEWYTATGQLCLNICSNDGEYFYWCHVTDNSRTYSDGSYSQSWSIDKNGPDTHLKWDYCVPSEVTNYDGQLPQLDEHDGGLEWHDPNDHDHNHENDQELTTGSYIKPKGPSSVLYRYTPCSGPCEYRQESRSRPICKVDSSHPMTFMIGYDTVFYCVNEQFPLRQQLSGLYRLWCQDACRKETSSHFFCTTLYGVDHCSPQPGIGSNGGKCAYPCQHYESLVDEYFFCYTKADNSTWEYCGQWDVPKEKQKVIEFTRYNYVCADYCRPDEDNTYEWCHHVYWDYNSTSNEASLMKTWDYCRGHVPPSMGGGYIALIIFGVIGAICVIVGVVYFFTK